MQGKQHGIFVGAEFKSYIDFEATLIKFSNASHTEFTVGNSRTVDLTNGSLKGEKYNVALKYTNALIGCEHYGTVRSKSKGLRPNQR